MFPRFRNCNVQIQFNNNNRNSVPMQTFSPDKV
jgi:hypothetical protein